MNPRFSQWNKKSDTKWKPRCTFCSKDFDIFNKSVAELRSHLSEKRHSQIASNRGSQTAAMFFRK